MQMCRWSWPQWLPWAGHSSLWWFSAGMKSPFHSASGLLAFLLKIRDVIFSSNDEILNMLTICYYKLPLIILFYNTSLWMEKSVHPVNVTQSVFVVLFSPQTTCSTENLRKKNYLSEYYSSSRCGAWSLTLWQTVMKRARLTTVAASHGAIVCRIAFWSILMKSKILTLCKLFSTDTRERMERKIHWYCSSWVILYQRECTIIVVLGWFYI